MKNFDIKLCMNNEELKKEGIKFIEMNETLDGMLYDANYDTYTTVENALKILDVMVDLANEMDFTIIGSTDDGLAIKFSKELSKRLLEKELITQELYDKYVAKMDEVIDLYKVTLS